MAKDESNARHVKNYRMRMRRAGLRLIQLWVPDTRAAGFADKCRRQSVLASGEEALERDTDSWLDSTRDTDDWTA